MKISDVIALSKAGFSREEIMRLAAISKDTKEETEPEPAPESPTAPDPAPSPAPEPAQAPEPEPEKAPDAGLDPAAVMEELLGIKAAIQTGNINHSQMPTPLTPAEAADQVLANIISPSIN